MSEIEIPSGAIREVGQITTGAGAIIGAVVEMDEAACKAAAKLFGEPVVLVSAAELARQREVIAGLRADKDGAYEERNRLVALLAGMFPSGTARPEIPGWDPEWLGCVYVDFPWGQASWHYHDSQAYLFAHLPPYAGEWDGHTTEAKYEAIARAALSRAQAGDGEGGEG